MAWHRSVILVGLFSSHKIYYTTSSENQGTPSVVGDKRKRAAGRIRQLLLTNPLNSQLDTNVAFGTVGKKWNLR